MKTIIARSLQEALVGPLHRVKVVELAGLAPAPFGCMVLADLGADVLRVTRRMTHEQRGIVPPAGPLDRGKHAVALNLKQQRDREALMVLVDSADVFVEGYRPGVAERLGIGPDDLMGRNRRLIYGRMTGWGQDGPLARTAGHDINYIAVSALRRAVCPVPVNQLWRWSHTRMPVDWTESTMQSARLLG